MATQNVYSIYAVNIAGTVIPVSSWSLSPGIAKQVIGVNGQVDPTFVYNTGQQQTISFATPDIKAVLTKLATPWQFLKLATPAVFYLQKHDPFGGRLTTSTFQSFTVATGLLVFRGLSATNGPAAVARFDVIPISSDGDTSPVIAASSVANPALSTSLAQAWTVGPVKINSANIEVAKYTGVQSIEIDPGVQIGVRGGDGQFFPTFVSVLEVRPTITVQFSDADVLADLGISGVKQAVADTTLFFRKIDKSGSRIALNVGDHLSIAVQAGTIDPTGAGGEHGDIAGSGLIITPVYDGTAVQLAFNLGTTIT